jgi:hypothetical protein
MGKPASPGTVFSLTGGLLGPGTPLQVWQTTQDAWFVRLDDAVIAADGTLTLDLPADGIVTASSLTTASHGQPASPIPSPAPFPLPYSDDFSAYSYDAMPRYLSDQVRAATTAGPSTELGPCTCGITPSRCCIVMLRLPEMLHELFLLCLLCAGTMHRFTHAQAHTHTHTHTHIQRPVYVVCTGWVFCRAQRQSPPSRSRPGWTQCM